MTLTVRTYRGSPLRLLTLLGPAIAFALVMAWLQGRRMDGTLGLWGHVFLGLTLMLVVIGVLHAIWPPRLTLDSRGVAFSSWAGRASARWRDIGEFSVVTPAQQLRQRLPWPLRAPGPSSAQKIGFDYLPGRPEKLTSGAGASRGLNGCDWATVNFWASSDSDLVAELNAFRATALAASPFTSTD